MLPLFVLISSLMTEQVEGIQVDCGHMTSLLVTLTR